MKTLRLILIAAVAALFSHSVLSQDWPAKPVRIVVPLSPGGFADVPARILAPRLSAQFGRQFFVENRAGAGGTIGADHVAKSEPDGHTLLFSATPHVIGAHLYKTLPYDALNDFAPVALVASGPYALVVNSQFPVASVRELIAAAKAEPGKIDYASSGNGSAQHLVTALFASMAGIDMNHVPYKGSGPAMQDLLSGQVKVHFAGIPNVLPHVKAGRIRALGVTGASRWPEMPDVPTIAEAGVPGYEATLWLGMMAPARTPQPIIDRVSSEIAKALTDPELLANLRNAGIAASYLPPREFGSFMRAEHAKWGKVVKDTGATIN